MATKEITGFDLNAFVMDETKMDEGIRVKLGDGAIWVRSWKSEIVKKTVKRKLKPHRKLLSLGAMPESLAIDLNAQIVAEAVVPKWEDLRIGKKKVGDWSTDACYKLMKEIPNFLDYVVDIAKEDGNYAPDDIEEEGN